MKKSNIQHPWAVGALVNYYLHYTFLLCVENWNTKKIQFYEIQLLLHKWTEELTNFMKKNMLRGELSLPLLPH
jgi:hypothetical protein